MQEGDAVCPGRLCGQPARMRRAESEGGAELVQHLRLGVVFVQEPEEIGLLIGGKPRTNRATRLSEAVKHLAPIDIRPRFAVVRERGTHCLQQFQTQAIHSAFRVCTIYRYGAPGFGSRFARERASVPGFGAVELAGLTRGSWGSLGENSAMARRRNIARSSCTRRGNKKSPYPFR